VTGARSSQAIAHPSLALIKYWGKQPTGINIPATTSIAVTLGGLESRTRAVGGDPDAEDRVHLGGVLQPTERYSDLFAAIRRWVESRGGSRVSYNVESENSFPTAAGLASSASGLAALVLATVRASLPEINPSDPETAGALSTLARIGSGSAARSIYGGFTRWAAGSERAEQIFPVDWWPELRVVVLPVTGGAKPISSRDAMNRTRAESPFYDAWVRDSEQLAGTAAEALSRRDLEQLGTAVRLSYMRMFATMLGANPPILYWHAATVAIIHELAALRRAGVPVWETIDAGPQVKVVTLNNTVPVLLDALRDAPIADPIVCTVGEGAR